ncbi:MAG TPA: hypothetical protein VFZ59_08970 [Verrucomicrobiae bacterium]|nr:hypothetical protein [Verrucomicrobiae bacterium]
MKNSLTILATMLIATSALHAQLVADGATNTLINVTNSIPGNVTVGTNGSFTLLVLSNNCLLTNSGFSTIGANASAKSNVAQLVSPTARWFMGANSPNFLFVGSNGAFNRLIVSNGATASVNANAYLGYISESASNNQVWVTGSNSVWSSAGSIEVGFLGSGNQVVVSNGGTVLANNAILGDATIASNNLAVVAGAGSLWSSTNVFYVGDDGSGNRLLVSEGGAVRSSFSRIGGALSSGSGNNLATITGSGSVWSNATDLEIGRSSGLNNQLVVSNGASVFVGGNALLGMSSGANAVTVTDPGTSWLVGNNLYVGSNGVGNRLVVSNGASVLASNLFVSLNASSTNNRVVVDGGALRVTNAASTGLLDVRRGTNVLNAGLVEVDQLLSTNSAGKFELNGGMLSARNMAINNGQSFRVGDGVRAATWRLVGNGFHAIAGDVIVSANGLLTGNGSIGGVSIVTVSSGGTVSPGDSIGRIVFASSFVNGAPSLQGTAIMEISKNGSILTNDQIQVNAALAYGGSLVVTKLGTNVLVGGDRFKMFDAVSYAGSFANITLPPLAPGQSWTNKLLLDGSIEVLDPRPRVTTLPVSGVGQTTAMLNGAANPNGSSSSAWFEFGLTTNYGSVTPPQALGSGSTDTNFNRMLTGLVANVYYHFRAVASNNFGVVVGADQSFRTFGDIVQHAYLKASNTGAGDGFGSSVALSGDTFVIGAPQEDSNATGVNGNQSDNSVGGAGAAYVFIRDGVNWRQQAYLKAANAVGVCTTGGCSGCSCYPGDFFGTSVAISGDIIVVGAPFDDSNAKGVNGDAADNSARDSGAAYVFVRNGTNWTHEAYLKASNAEGAPNVNVVGDVFGYSVAVSGETIVVGAPLEDSNATGVNGNQTNNSATDSGAAYVFMRNGTNWEQQAYLKASNTGNDDGFGGRVAISANTIIVGARGEEGGQGAAYVFVRTGTNWTQQKLLKASNPDSQDFFGSSVAISVDTVVVGAPSEDSNATGVNGNGSDNSATNAGAAYIFVRNGTNWTQEAYLKASNAEGSPPPGIGNNFGSSVAVSGDMVAVGAPFEDSNATGINGNQSNNSALYSGAAYVFVRNGASWSQHAYVKASNTGVIDSFGTSVAASGDTVLVGANFEESNATGVNGDQNNNSAINSGAAYVFELSDANPPLLSIFQSGVSQVTLSWTPPTPGFGLQETLSLAPVAWSNSPSGQTNPITLPASGQTRFFRLFKP